MKELLFIDQDGVLCDFEKLFYQMYPQAVDMDGQEREDLIDKAQATPGFYRDLPPMKGAIESFILLSEKYDCYILSAPSWNDPHSYSEKREWVEIHLGDLGYRKLILSHNKGLFKGRALIDDRKKYNVDLFNGEHIHFGTDKFPDWTSVIKYLL